MYPIAIGFFTMMIIDNICSKYRTKKDDLFIKQIQNEIEKLRINR